MKERTPDPRSVDLRALCRSGRELQGHLPLGDMSRLGSAFSGPSDASAGWSARGELRPIGGAEPELWLHLQADALAPLICQRCLQPLVAALRIDRRVRFVRNEDEAARLDEESEDDVLTLPPRLDLLALIEDELILALPLVPMHVECPQPLARAQPEALISGPESPAAHPFAALAALRRGFDKSS